MLAAGAHMDVEDAERAELWLPCEMGSRAACLTKQGKAKVRGQASACRRTEASTCDGQLHFISWSF